MNEEVKITIIVPAYNVEAWISRCIESVVSQTHKNLEIIVVDDGSYDSTSSIVDSYAVQDERIVAVHQENSGLVAVRELGISLATGEYVGFVDGDDYVEPDLYERLIDNALRYKAQISQCAIQVCYSDGRKEPVCGSGKISVYDRLEGSYALLNDTFMESSLCNNIYHISILENSCLDPTVINNEDLLRNVVLFGRAQRIVREEFCGYHYCSRSGSMSNGAGSIEIGRNSIKARRIILNYVENGLRSVALKNYLQGAINTYNALIDNNSKDAVSLREECICILKQFGLKKIKKASIINIKAFLIVYFPKVYVVIKKAFITRHNRLKKR